MAPFMNATEIQIKQRTVGNSLITKKGGFGMGPGQMDGVLTERGERSPS